MFGYVIYCLFILKSIINKTVGNKVLNLSQLKSKSTYAQTIFNESPLQFLNNRDEKFLRNLRNFSHNLGNYNLNDPDFKVT